MKKKLDRSQSQEEAALVLQKHYRGYQVRNKIDSVDTKLDATTRKLLKTFCKKWKAKSLYQVILLDRANKLQEVVYFSLQVHMYNQHVVCNLNNVNHQPVVLGNVMSATSVNDFLGGKKCYSHKIPFQLNRMDTAIKRNLLTVDENMTENVDDHNWDSPLNRLPEARTAFKILKHSFAVRDQGVQVGMSEGVRYANTDSKNEYKQPYQKYEETPSKQPTAEMADERYNAAEKKYPKPVAPTTKSKITKPLDKSNPVLELQSRGKQYRPAADPNEDDPPYNFQGMLKKTDCSRRSLKGGRTAQQVCPSNGTSDAADERPVVSAETSAKDLKNELNRTLSEATRTELLPGVVLEGSSCDL